MLPDECCINVHVSHLLEHWLDDWDSPISHKQTNNPFSSPSSPSPNNNHSPTDHFPYRNNNERLAKSEAVAPSPGEVRDELLWLLANAEAFRGESAALWLRHICSQGCEYHDAVDGGFTPRQGSTSLLHTMFEGERALKDDGHMYYEVETYQYST